MKRKQARRPGAPRTRWNRNLAVTLVSGLALLLVLGLVFSVAYGSQRITTSAGALHDADETLRAATVARAQLALGVHMATVDREFGTNSGQALELSVTEAGMALTDLETGIEQLYGDGSASDPRLGDAATQFTEEGRRIMELLDAGDVDAARALSATRFDSSFGTLTGLLVDLRDELSLSVESSDQLLGRIGNIARFLVAFLVPAAVIVVYRELVRRQQRQVELETRLEAERHINAAREAFIANASHELRTPLTSILGLSMMLAESETVKEEPAAADLINIIISESDDLARMVEDLLTVARLDAGALHYTFEDVDVQEEVDHVTEGLIRSGMNIAIACERASIRADRLRFRQTLRNLLSNARKYGGPHVRIEGRVEGRTYLCTVVDDGQGIDEDLAPRLFERFIHQGHQTASKDSVGLGLSIVHALAQGMGGSITYDRVDGETRFGLRLPLATEDLQTTPVITSVPTRGASQPTFPAALPARGIAASTEYTEPDPP